MSSAAAEFLHPAIRKSRCDNHCCPRPTLGIQSLGTWPSSLGWSHPEWTQAFPESTVCGPRRTICRACMHHWHTKIFPLPGTQQPSPHQPTLHLGITWETQYEPQNSNLTAGAELRWREHTFRTRKSYRMASGMVSGLRLPESKCKLSPLLLVWWWIAPTQPQCLHVPISEMEVRIPSMSLGCWENE